MNRFVQIKVLAPAQLAAPVLIAADTAFACPNCKDSLSHNDPTASGLVQGYFWSILFMLSMPFTLLTCLCAYFYVLVRRARRSPAAMAAAVSPESLVLHSNLPRWNPATMQS